MSTRSRPRDLGTTPQRIPASGQLCSFKATEGSGIERAQSKKGENDMLKWAATFLIIAIIAALLGFTGIAGAAADIARFLFFLFIAIFVIMFLLAIFAGRKIF